MAKQAGRLHKLLRKVLCGSKALESCCGAFEAAQNVPRSSFEAQ